MGVKGVALIVQVPGKLLAQFLTYARIRQR